MNQTPSQETYLQNLQLMAQLYPHYVPQIEAASANGAYTFEDKSADVVLCQQNADGAWIHGPNDPWKTAEATLRNSDADKQRLFIILRPGLGYLPLHLYPQLRKGRNAQRMLIIEDRIDLLHEAFKRFDWTDMLRSDRTILILDPNPAETVLKFVHTNPVSALVPVSVQCGVEWGDYEKRMVAALQQHYMPMAEQVYKASQQYMGEIFDHFKQPAAGRKRKVVLVEPEHDYLSNALSQGFEDNGLDAASFTANKRMINFLNPYVWLVYTREHFPDVLLWMNRNTLSDEGAESLSKLPIKKVLWFLDSPKRVQTTKEELDATDAYFSFDPTYLDYLKELSGKEGTYLPTAAGIRPLPECQPGKEWPQRTGPKVGFMGALAAARFQEVRAYWLKRDPDFVVVLDGIVEDYLADESVTLEERFNQSKGRERLPYEGFVVLYLEERATYLKRLAALRRVNDLGLQTYGSPEWGAADWAQELVGCYAGYAPEYNQDLPSVYYHAQVNINVFHVQCFNSANPRVYDVLAAGGFLLTEYKPVLEEEFELNKHLVCFHSLDELREKTEYYLEHADERDAIARAGQEFALNHCTYSQRVKTIMKTLYGEDEA
ncbi:MAG: glycosyltransferase [Candidatus Hinthialibacter antarcticus]|nr:glycosyltransferase [Candidatus Hinthialibacter antarcticus]